MGKVISTTMSDLIKINIKVFGCTYGIFINLKDEYYYRYAANLLNNNFEKYKNAFSSLDTLAGTSVSKLPGIAALDLVIKYLKALDKIEALEEERDNLQNSYSKIINSLNETKVECDELKKIIEKLRTQIMNDDPLFDYSNKKDCDFLLQQILALPIGKFEQSDKKYESYMYFLLKMTLYPELDLAKEQCRTINGVQIKDLLFYNRQSTPFLQEIHKEFKASHIVFELKNVNEVTTQHINQLNRYLSDNIGLFGILFTRKKPTHSIIKNTIDLWSGQRRVILILNDDDLEQICEVYKSKIRHPIDIINKKYIDFKLLCPS